MARYCWIACLALAACGSPDQVGQTVGRSLYDASVSTSRALSVAGDRTGAAIENAGANLRNAVSPPPPVPTGYGQPLQLPPPYVPDGYAPPAPVTAQPLGPGPGAGGYDPYRDGPRDTPANPAAGY